MYILGLPINAEDHGNPKPGLHGPGDFQTDFLQRRGFLQPQKQDLPGGVAQDDAALLLNPGADQPLHLLQHQLALQGAGIFLPVSGGGHDAPPGAADVDAQGEAPFGEGLGVAQTAAQNPVLQEPAAHPLVQLTVIQHHPFPDQDFRHFLDDLTVFDYLGIVAGDADDPLHLAVHFNGQIDAPADIGKLRLQLRCDVVFRQMILNDAIGAGVKVPDPGGVIAGDDVTGFVHQIDVLPDQLADFFHNLLGAAFGYFHILPPGLSRLRRA